MQYRGDDSLPIPEIAAMLANRAEALCRELLPNGRICGAEWQVGSIQGEPGKSLGVHLTGAKAGVWCDFAAGQSGDPIDLARAVLGCSKGEAIRWAKDWLGLGNKFLGDSLRSRPPKRPPPTGLPDKARAKRLAVAAEIWRETVPAVGTPGEIYLHGRAITTPIPNVLRFAYLKHPATGLTFPTLVAKLQGPDGRGTGIHRTFLGACGKAKAGVSTPKMAKGILAGSAVRLAEAGQELGIAEGIEDALSVIQLYGVPTWAACGGANMSNVALPDIVESVTIFGDNGEAGHALADRAAEAFHKQGRKVQLAYPDEAFDDFNSVLKARAGRAAA